MLLSPTPDATGEAHADGSTARPWAVFSVLAAMAAMTILDVSKVGVVLPIIQRSLGGNQTSVQLMVVGYTMAYALFLLPSGRLGDIVSRKKVFLFGSVVFVVASVSCALAPDTSVLIVARMVQGAGAGILMPQVLGLIQHLFAPKDLARPLATLAATIALTAMIGPVIAGVVVQLAGPSLGWRLLFWINVAFGLIVLPLAWRFVREPGSERRVGFDRTGVMLLVPAIVLTVFPVSTVSASTPIAPWMVASVLAGLVCAGLLVAHQRRLARGVREPLIDPALFRIQHFPSGVGIAGLMYATGTGSTLIITLFYEEQAGQSPLRTAAWMLPSALSMILGSWLAGRTAQRMSRRLITVGAAANSAGLMTIAVAIGSIPPNAVLAVLACLLLVTSFGSSLVASSNQVRSLQGVPAHRSSVAGSMLQVSQRIGSAFGMAIALVAYYGYLDHAVPVLGRRTLGPTVAVGICAGFSLLALVVAALDRDAR
ncbi:MAG: transporter [Actinomycetia bacterium]|nr:transporter [Actinomycetes bacterium]